MRYRGKVPFKFKLYVSPYFELCIIYRMCAGHKVGLSYTYCVLKDGWIEKLGPENGRWTTAYIPYAYYIILFLWAV